MRYDTNNARCEVFTFKEGLLSAIAHDLRIKVTGFSVEVDRAARIVEARFEAASLRVECARKADADAPDLLSPKDRGEIEHNIARDVLDAARYPEIEFRSTDIADAPGGHRVRGTLSLHGRDHDLDFTTRTEGDHETAEVTLHQPDFGIKPYSAMLGTLKVKPDVKIVLTLPR